MKLLITGAKGQLGQDLHKACQGRDIASLPTDLDDLDITDLRAVRALVISEKPTAIVNCAAYNAVDRAETEFHQACLVNGIGPRNLAIAAEESGIPVMHFSTDFVFDGEKDAPYTIADNPNPINRYGESKLLGERQIAALSRRHYLVRLSWVFGAGNVNFPKKVLSWAKSRKALRVVTDQVSCPAYTADLVPIILDLLESGAFGLYHLANTGHCSRHEWARFILGRVMPEVRVEPATSEEFPGSARRPRFSAMDLFPLGEGGGRLPPDWRDATVRFLAEIGATP